MSTQRRPRDPLELLREAGEKDPIPAGAAERVLARLGTSLAASAIPATRVRGASSTPTASFSGGGVASFFALGSVPAFVVGAMVGAGLHALLAPAKTKTVYAERAAASALASSLPPRGNDEAPLLSASEVPSHEEPLRTEAAATPPKALESSLARERALLDRARAKMSAGEPNAALSLAETHARTYPHGVLVEEREAMMVNALVSLGRYAQAQKRGTAFRERFPASLMLPSVDAALAAIPEP